IRSAFVDKLSATIRERVAKRRAQRQDQFPGDQSWRGSRLESLDSRTSIYSENTKEVDVVPANDGHGGHYIVPVKEEEDWEVTEMNGGRVRQSSNPRLGLSMSPTVRAPAPVHLTTGKQPTGPCSLES